MNYILMAIFGKQVLKQIDSADYVDWAEAMLVQGYDSHSLRILAGLDRCGNDFEAEDYFHRSLKELRLSMPDAHTAMRAYACAIAQQMIEGKITGREGVPTLYQIYQAIDYPPDLFVWYELSDELNGLLIERNGGLVDDSYYPTDASITLADFDNIAKQEAANFIATVCPQTAI